MVKSYDVDNPKHFLEYISNLGCTSFQSAGVIFVSAGNDVIGRMYNMNSDPENPQNGKKQTRFSPFGTINTHPYIKEGIEKYFQS